MPTKNVSDRKDWGQLGQGVHICSIYRNEDEQIEPILPYFWSGFDRLEKCLYFYDERAPKTIAKEFEAIQNDPEDFTHTGQVEVLHYRDVYFENEDFDPDTMISKLEENIALSFYEGFSGVRAAGEMSWVIGTDTPVEKYIEYETKLNDFYPTSRLTGICQFDESKFSKEFLADMILTHPYIILYGKLYQNRRFFTNGRLTKSPNTTPIENFDSLVSAIREEEPLIA